MSNHEILQENFFVMTCPNVIESEEQTLFMTKSLNEIWFG